MLIQPRHIPGRHCASTALSNLAAFHGPGWSEAMCFGLGSGLGFWYITSTNPSRMIHVRSADVEEQFFVRIGMPMQWRTFETPDQSLDYLIETLDAGRPAIIRTDIFYLPYYRSNTHFPGHVITVWGYDQKGRLFLVTDTERPGLIEVGFDDMDRARFCGDVFFHVRGDCLAPESLPPPVDMAATIRGAIVHNSATIMESAADGQGMAGLRRFREELELWAVFEDRNWVFRFAYQVIERRGTGGGGFRRIYRDFLEEAGSLLPAVQRLNLSGLMGEAADAWTTLSTALKDASEEDVPDMGGIRDCLEKVIAAEAAYHRAALQLADA